MSDRQTLLGYLESFACGKAYAVKRADLAESLGATVREIKFLCEELRLEGIPVCYSTDSEQGGVYLAANNQEIEEAIGKLSRLGISILRERSAMKRALKKTKEKIVQKDLFEQTIKNLS